MDTLLRYSNESMEFVLEGSEEFVRERMDEFLPLLLTACGLKGGEEDDGGIPTLKRWYERTVPPGRNPTMQDHILIFAYYLNKVRRQFVFTPDDMKASFGEVGREVPKSLLQIMGSLKRDHNLLWPGDKRGEYCLLPAAMRHVEKILGLEPTVGEELPPPPQASGPAIEEIVTGGEQPEMPGSPAQEKFASLFNNPEEEEPESSAGGRSRWPTEN